MSTPAAMHAVMSAAMATTNLDDVAGGARRRKPTDRHGVRWKHQAETQEPRRRCRDHGTFHFNPPNANIAQATSYGHPLCSIARRLKRSFRGSHKE
jgi:hypothetical protein